MRHINISPQLFAEVFIVHSCNSPDSLPLQDVIWVASDAPAGGVAGNAPSEYTITELADEFGITLRALRFYDGRGLLSPRREGRKRLFSAADRDRLALILKGKKLGFTLAEISQMVEAQSGHASGRDLNLTAEKCLAQIAYFEKQMREASEALTELRRIHLMLCKQAAAQKRD